MRILLMRDMLIQIILILSQSQLHSYLVVRKWDILTEPLVPLAGNLILRLS